jgi:hypothetical protein
VDNNQNTQPRPTAPRGSDEVVLAVAVDELHAAACQRCGQSVVLSEMALALGLVDQPARRASDQQAVDRLRTALGIDQELQRRLRRRAGQTQHAALIDRQPLLEHRLLRQRADEREHRQATEQRRQHEAAQPPADPACGRRAVA